MIKLLLADDSITIQKVVELVLADEGFEIKAASNGEDALALIPSFKPDIVLADIEMPKMNGYNLCEKIKANPATRAIPVILLAGAFEPLDHELAKKVGAEDFLIKPFESEDLISKIKASLGAAKAVSKAPLEEALAEAVPEEAAVAEEDLWGMEELAGEEAAVEATEIAVDEAGIEALLEEAIMPEEALLEEALLEEVSMPEEEALLEEAIMPEEEALLEEAAIEEVMPSKPAVERLRPEEVAVPSSDALLSAFRKAAEETLRGFLKTADLKNEMSTLLRDNIKDSVEKVLWEIAPELIDKLAHDAMKTTIESLTKQVEKVIWETVPDIAETIIKKEIEKIKSEF